MTFRPPATTQKRRKSRQSDTRRSIYMTILFGVATFAAVALLGGVLLGNYYTDHWAPVSSVQGTAISKDAVRDRASVDMARFQRQILTYQLLRNQGRITTDEYTTISTALTGDEASTTLYQGALSQLQSDLVIARYADQNGIHVSDADVDAQILKDATIPEMRHVKIIAVDAPPTPPANGPTADQIAAAKAKVEGYLAEVKGGKAWDDVYTESTADGNVGSAGSNAGDLGLEARDQLNLDPDLIDAIFKLQKANDVTAVFKGDDGIFRIATVTKILTPYVDPGWKDAVGQASSGDGYRGVARADALLAAVRKTVETKYVSNPTKMRQVQEIAVSPGFGQPGDGPEYKFKMMVFAPNHDTSAASSVAANDPAWTAAKKRADDAVAALQKDPTQFAKLAKDTTNNDDQFVASQGGDLPWVSGPVIYDSSGNTQQTLNMPALRTALMGSDVKPGILAPILEPAMGYVVVDYQGTRAAPAQRIGDAQLLMASNLVSFSDAVAQYSEASDAVKGGDMGWVAPYTLPTEMEQVVFSTPIGAVSTTVSSANGYWIFRIVAEKTRVGDATEQAKALRSVWTGWLDAQVAAANVWTDSTALTALTPTASP